MASGAGGPLGGVLLGTHPAGPHQDHPQVRRSGHHPRPVQHHSRARSHGQAARRRPLPVRGSGGDAPQPRAQLLLLCRRRRHQLRASLQECPYRGQYHQGRAAQGHRRAYRGRALSQLSRRPGRHHQQERAGDAHQVPGRHHL